MYLMYLETKRAQYEKKNDFKKIMEKAQLLHLILFQLTNTVKILWKHLTELAIT